MLRCRLDHFFALAKSLFFVLLFLPAVAFSDVVKPALVEISTYTTGKVEIEIRASIEALLTGINAQYKNTKDAPNAEEYDQLRALPGDELGQSFAPFQAQWLASISLTADAKTLPLSITDIHIPEAGYTQVPRISTITLSGELDRSYRHLQWFYPEKFGDNAVRVRQVDEANHKWHWSEWQWLRKNAASEPFSLEALFTQRSMHEVVLSYISIGFDHIIPKGMDHILFILGIFLLSAHWRPLLGQVTMFTVAHTITLGLSMNGLINLPAHIVEPLIALSIAYIGIENIFAHRLRSSRLLLVFIFGLLHGMGFAGVLLDFGMPENAFATALISFNIGVELGQIAVITLAFILTRLWIRSDEHFFRYVTVPASALIAVTGLYWTLERLEWLT